MKSWGRWIAGAAAAASLASAPGLAQDYNAYPSGPPPGQGTYQPQPQTQGGYDQYGEYDQDGLNFRSTLSPYGEWISVQGIGQVWHPFERTVGSDFQPYATAGHWVYTDYGWTWQSDYPWGWAPFHYGRWVYRPRLGWLWRPGREWAPAWVEWRQGAGYVGWAPMHAEGVEWVEPMNRPSWCFVDEPHFVSLRLPSVMLAPERVRITLGTTAPISARRSYDRGTFYMGPPVAHMATSIGRPIAPVSADSGHFGWRAPPRPVGAPPGGMGTGGRYVPPPPPAGGHDWRDDRHEDRREDRREERQESRPVYVAPPPARGSGAEYRERQEERREQQQERKEEKREEKREDHDNGHHGGDRHHDR